MEIINVLLIEDDMGDAQLITDLLAGSERARFRVECVHQLAEGEELLASRLFDIILLDLGLPDSQGMDTLDEMCRVAGRTPIVVLTGNKNDALGMEASRMGAQDYLTKGEMNIDSTERSILYAIERKRAQEEIRSALQTYSDVVQRIPSGLMTFQYMPPDHLFLLSANPRASEILRMHPLSQVGKDFYEVWPESRTYKAKERLLKVIATGRTFEKNCMHFHLGSVKGAYNLKAFCIPNDRLCLSFEDMTDRILEEELRKKAYEQIEKNVEHFATLVDEIRNPNSVIINLAERSEDEICKGIIVQAERIENIINQLDNGWLDSEKLRQFLRKSI